MKGHKKVLIAGAGGIGKAVGLLLREIGETPVDLYVGDGEAARADEAVEWIKGRSAIPGEVRAFHLPHTGENGELTAALDDSDVLLDCLPGGEAPRMARLARAHGLHYANLTEYVAETDEIVEVAHGAETGFVLQTGLAPGFINVLGHGLFQAFCRHYRVERVERLGIRTGALTETALPPHYYGFTWSPIGVATEYLKECRAVRDYQPVDLPALSEVERIVLGGETYEEGLTSGGVADLPRALAGRVRNLDYKTLRYPGHYGWVRSLIEELPAGDDRPERLERRMREVIPQVDNDVVVVYAFVEGHDGAGNLHRAEALRAVGPYEVGGRYLRAIQATTAAGLAESARLLLEGRLSGVVLQSDLDPKEFLSGPYVDHVYESATILDESGLTRRG